MDKLKDHTEPVRAFIRPHHRGAGPGFVDSSLAYGDMEDRDSLRRAMEGVDTAFLVSSISPNALDLQCNVIDAARESGVKRVVRISSVGANAKARPRISRMHGNIDDYLKQSGIAYTILCPHFFMQNLDAQRLTLLEDGDIYAPAGDGKIGLVHAEDIAECAVAALLDERHAGKTYTITGPEALDFHQLASSLTAAMNWEIQFVDISSAEFRRLMIDGGADPWLAEAIDELYAVFKAGYGKMVSSGVKRLTGSEPRPFSLYAESFASSPAVA